MNNRLTRRILSKNFQNTFNHASLLEIVPCFIKLEKWRTAHGFY